VSALFEAVPGALDAHFKMLEPASWIGESERGDPQKSAPCGSLLHLKLVETIDHPATTGSPSP